MREEQAPPEPPATHSARCGGANASMGAACGRPRSGGPGQAEGGGEPGTRGEAAPLTCRAAARQATPWRCCPARLHPRCSPSRSCCPANTAACTGTSQPCSPTHPQRGGRRQRRTAPPNPSPTRSALQTCCQHAPVVDAEVGIRGGHRQLVRLGWVEVQALELGEPGLGTTQRRNGGSGGEGDKRREQRQSVRQNTGARAGEGDRRGQQQAVRAALAHNRQFCSRRIPTACTPFF